MSIQPPPDDTSDVAFTGSIGPGSIAQVDVVPFGPDAAEEGLGLGNNEPSDAQHQQGDPERPPPLLHPQLRLIFFYMFAHATTLGIAALAIPHLMLSLMDDDSSATAYFYAWTSAMTAGIGFLWYPVLGMLSDYFGRKPFILLSLSGSILWNSCTAAFANQSILIFAAVVRGLTDVSYTMSWAVLGDVTVKHVFINNYGKLAAAAGVGIVVGPLLALVFSLIEANRVPFLVAAVIGICNFIFVSTKYEETLYWFDRKALLDAAAAAEANPNLPHPPPLHIASFREVYARHTLNPFRALYILSGSPTLWALALALFLNLIGFTGAVSVFYLYLKERFDWGTTEAGGIIFFLGIMSIISNALVLPYFMRAPWMSEQKIVAASMISSLCLQLVWILVPDTPTIALICLILAFILCQPAFFLASCIRALISRQIEPNKQGKLQGALACLTSLASIIGPLLLTLAFGYAVSDTAPMYLPQIPFIISFVLNLFVAVLLWWVCKYHLPPSPSQQHRLPTTSSSSEVMTGEFATEQQQQRQQEQEQSQPLSPSHSHPSDSSSGVEVVISPAAGKKKAHSPSASHPNASPRPPAASTTSNSVSVGDGYGILQDER